MFFSKQSKFQVPQSPRAYTAIPECERDACRQIDRQRRRRRGRVAQIDATFKRLQNLRHETYPCASAQEALPLAELQFLEEVLAFAPMMDLFESVDGEKSEIFLRVIEGVATLLTWLPKISNLAELVTCVAAVYSQVTGKSSLLGLFRHLKDLIVGIFSDDDGEGNSSVQLQAAEENVAKSSFVDSVKLLFSSAEKIHTSPMVTKIVKLITSVSAYSMLAMLGLNPFGKHRALVDSVIHSAALFGADGFLARLADTLKDVVSRVYRAVQSGSLDPLFDEGEVTKWINRSHALLARSEELVNPIATGLDVSQFLFDLNELINESDVVSKTVGADKEALKAVRGLSARLKLLQLQQLQKEFAQKTRLAPFSTLLYGTSGVAKTSLKMILCNHWSKVNRESCDDKFLYHRNHYDTFYSGFESYMHTVILDDVACVNPNKGVTDESLRELLQLNNNVPVSPNMASLEDKGKKPIRIGHLVATTNTFDLNAQVWFSNPAAVRRRFPYVIEVSIKDEFLWKSTDGSESSMVDPKLIPDLEAGKYLDIWKLRVHEVRAVPDPSNLLKEKSSVVMIEEFLSIAKFLAWYGKTSITHKNNQIKMVQMGERIKNTEACLTCYAPKYACECEQVPVVDDKFCSGCNDEIQFCTCDVKVEDQVGEIALAQVLGPLDGPRAWVERSHESYRKLCVDLRTSEVGVKTSHVVAGTTAAMLGGFYYLSDEILRLAKLALCSVAKEKAIGFVKKCFASLLGDWRFKALMCALTVLGTYLVMKRCSKKASAVEEQILGEVVGPRNPTLVGKTPANLHEDENVWTATDYTCVAADVTRHTKSWKNMPFDEVCHRVGKNSVSLRMHLVYPSGRETIITGKATSVGGQYYLTNNHNFPIGGQILDLEVIRDRVQEGVTPNVHCVLHECDLVRFPEQDLLIFQLENCSNMKNIVDLFASTTLDGVHRGALVSRREDGSVETLQMANVRRDRCFAMQNEDGSRHINDVWYGKPQTRTTVKGDCGSVMVLDTPAGPAIVGIHKFMLRDSDLSGSVVVDIKPLIAAADAKFGKVIIQGDLPDITVKEKILPLHKKSVFNWFPTGTANVYGSIDAFKSTYKSQVCSTVLQPALMERGWQVKCGAPKMSGFEPWRLSAIDTVNQKANIRSDMLEEVKRAYLNDVLVGLDLTQLEELVNPLSFEAAVNGVPGVRYLDKLNRNTSAGYPFNKQKKHLLEPIDGEDIWSDGVMPTAEVMERVRSIEHHYVNRTRACPLFVAHLKDQAIPFSKIAIGKTRVMNGAPMDWSIVVRRYLLSFVRLFQKNKFLFEGAPGTVAQSVEWQQWYNYLTRDGTLVDKMIAGDYKLFDKNMEAKLILAAYWVIIEIYKKAGVSQEYVDVLWGIAYDTAFSFVNFNGDLVEFFGSNPSGHPLTVIVNCIVNSFYMRLAYLILAGEQGDKREFQTILKDFKTDVRLVTYGDDNAMSSTRDWFNHTNVARVLASVGVTYTMADKGAESVPFIHIRDVSFLKRKWVFNTDVGYFLCPLENDSIENMLLTGLKSKCMADEAVAVEKVGTALREYFYYGEARFTEMRRFLKEVVDESHLNDWVCDATFPTWKELKDQFISNSERMLKRQGA